MSVDQALLMSAEDKDCATLRFYGWSEPTLSLGYFQKYDDRKNHLGSSGCSLVRRRSGGGAILHDNELTYSLALPSTHRWSSQNSQLYDLVHELIISLLAKQHLTASLHRDAKPFVVGEKLQADQQPLRNQRPSAVPFVSSDAFLCFQRRTAGDIVMDGFKVMGSAQRRLKHSLLQHGSLLLGRSAFASELPGVAELGKPFDVQEFANSLADELGEKLKLNFARLGLREDEFEKAKEIEGAVFGRSNWNKKR